MKSIVVLVAAAAAFLFLLLRPYADGRAVIEREQAALEHVTRLEPGLVDGYRFEWHREGTLPAVFVARPEQAGDLGRRWFATRTGKFLFQFDTVRHHAIDGRTNVDRLRRFLALTPEEKKAAGVPLGWELLVHSR